MTDLGEYFVDSAVQCWSCPIFDRMFQIVSEAAAVAYEKFAWICTVLFIIIFAFYIFGAVWKNITKGFQDGWFDKSLRPVFVNSLVVLAFLGMGAMLPRFITTVTFEPVAEITQTYAESMVKMTPDFIDENVVYEPEDFNDDKGIFRKELRDSIIDTAKVTITMFQVFMKLGVAMLDAGFSWSAFFGIGAFVKHFILAVIGFYLLYGFFKMFFQFLCYFADVIIAMAMFAFFFPLSLVTAAFRDAEDMPGWLNWVKSFGKSVGVDQIKNLVSAIISLGVAVITYTIILVILVKFFDGSNNFQNLLTQISSGAIFDEELNQSGLNDLTMTSVVVLVYVLSFIYKNIPKVTETILQMFEVKADDNKAGNALGDSVMKATKNFVNTVKDKASIIKNHGAQKA